MLRRNNCPSASKCNILHVLFLVLVLSTLTLLALSSLGWISLSLVGPKTEIHYMVSALSRILGKGRSTIRNNETDQLVLEAYNNFTKIWTATSKNCSISTTSLPESNSTQEHQRTFHVYEYLINEPDKCKDDAPFLVLLVTVERQQKEARQAIRQTWGKENVPPGIKVLRLFFIGKDAQWSNDSQMSLVEESHEYHDIIQQDYLDVYRNLTEKVLMGLYWVATYCKSAIYVMKTDSDMFVNTEYLIHSILKPDQPPRLNYFTGYLMVNEGPNRNKDSKWYASPEEYPENQYPLYCSGTGYVFSSDLACKIAEISPTVRWFYLEDVYIGLCLKKLGLEPVASPNRGDFNLWKVAYSDCIYKQIVTSHQLKPWEIIDYWTRLQQNKHKCA
ncbi:beta-1,3-galactosyltransferase 2-like [Hyperolius riggenbachi]|uniref:beta-1,3-galactosyltransferase 2-like n=1 Tax=Hyperolius riggenbachi TaxID=752182 RepID=UPI0035A28FD6